MLRRMLKLTAKAAEAAAKGAANLLGGSPASLEEQQQAQHGGAVQPSCTVRLLPRAAGTPPDGPAGAKHTTRAGAMPSSPTQRASPRSAAASLLP